MNTQEVEPQRRDVIESRRIVQSCVDSESRKEDDDPEFEEMTHEETELLNEAQLEAADALSIVACKSVDAVEDNGTC